MCLIGPNPSSTRISLCLRSTSEGKVRADRGCTSGIRSEVIELKVGREGHVLPWQPHVVEFQVVGVTTGQTEPGMCPGSSRSRFLLWGPFQN